MARYKDYQKIDNSDRYDQQHRFDPSLAFVRWLWNTDGDGYAGSDHWEMVVCGELKITCLLDYLYAWLSEGGAKSFCPSYEDWLLTIIVIANQFQVGTFAERFGEEGHEIFQIDATRITSQSWVGMERHPGDLPAPATLPLLDSGIDIHHPALDRRVFALCSPERRDPLAG